MSLGKRPTSLGKVDKIAWVKYQGDTYGVAHARDGEALGNVRIERKTDHFYITAYTFKDKMKVVKHPLSRGECGATTVAALSLTELIEAA
jgi:hypothetical protein